DGDTNHINNTIIDGSQPSNPDSGSVVYFVSNEDTNSVLTGFTITGGSGTSLIFLPGWDPKKAGGGIFVLWSGAKIQNNKIINNNVTAIGDTAVDGPAITAGGGSADYVIIRDNQISENSATQVEHYALGGAVTWAGVGTCLFERNRVTANVCTADMAFGGGLSILGRVGLQWTYIVRNNIIKDNILNALDYGGGGGIHIVDCSPEVTNNIISGNVSSHEGGGVWVEDWPNQTGVPKPVFINNTITNNSATHPGGGIYVSGSPQVNVKMMNNILWGNSAPDSIQIDTHNGATIQVRYSDVQGGWPGEGNIDTDPLLAADSLTDSSSCIGAGILQSDFGDGLVLYSPDYDINGRMRPSPAGTNPDMGAWESKWEVPVGLENEIPGLPKKMTLFQNYPNPFNPKTTINYQLPMLSNVELSIYNLLGQKVATLVSKQQSVGYYQIDWDASGFASGIYYYRIEAQAT
ncbi:MAG: T9SS type A sorting domain-containing protein, partial [Chloroflexi bacterium]|nr:T9SS type A sorting domain-containing protein [Chloroflexota bacterium]